MQKPQAWHTILSLATFTATILGRAMVPKALKPLSSSVKAFA